MMGHFSLPRKDISRHLLLEAPSPAYSPITIRRAVVVWVHCGQQNEFRQVCNYFHHLESMEEKLSAEERATSRGHEYNLISNFPPSSHFLSEHFPKLYQYNKDNKINTEKVEENTLEKCVFNLEGFHDIKIHRGATTKYVLEISQMIRNYCKSHSKSLRNLLAEFHDFAKKSETPNDVDNIAMYINKKYIKDELVTWSNTPRSFSFLHLEDADNIIVRDIKTEDLRDDTSPTLAEDHTFVANKNANKIEILINESRRKELFIMIPNNDQNVLSANFTKMQDQKHGSVLYARNI